MKSQCCNPDMRYENPLYMAELAAMADLIAAGRLQLGVDFNLKMLDESSRRSSPRWPPSKGPEVKVLG